MKIIQTEAGNIAQRLSLLLEAGATFSAKNKAAIQSAIDALQGIIDGAADANPNEEPPPPAQEAATTLDLSGDIIPLQEASAISKDGIARVKVISPGIGTSGYYSPAVLKAAAAKFAGAQSYWDHPTTAEEATRPERSLRDLAGKVTGTPVWDEAGPTGPGVYADVQVFKPYIEAVKELAPHIGVSIRATGTAKQGEVNGKRMPVIEGIEMVKSVDFVTQAGRGGEILQLFEAARQGPANIPARSGGDLEVSLVDEKEAQALREAKAALEAERDALKAENKRMKEAELLAQAQSFVAGVLKESKLPEITQTRLAEALAKSPVLKDGVLDEAAYKAKIEEAVKAEAEYLAKITGSGKIVGMGGTTEVAGSSLREAHYRSFIAQGETPERAKELSERATR